MAAFSGLVNGLTLLNDGIAGAGFNAGRTFFTRAGGAGAGTGAGACLGGEVG